MADKKQSLFREKSLDTIESPESLNEYLKVTSPGVWLFLLAVILILVGTVVWGIFGRIDTSVNVAVVSKNSVSFAYVPYDKYEDILEAGKVTVGDYTYTFTGEIIAVDSVSNNTEAKIRIAGEFEIGDVYAVLMISEDVNFNVKQGVVVTESLTPISLLLQ